MNVSNHSHSLNKVGMGSQVSQENGDKAQMKVKKSKKQDLQSERSSVEGESGSDDVQEVIETIELSFAEAETGKMCGSLRCRIGCFFKRKSNRGSFHHIA